MIEIVSYNVSWPALFATEAVAIRDALGALARRIEHVGSTSVPGLAAKAVIDIQISVQSLEPLSVFGEPLGRIGYIHVMLGEFDLVYPFFQKPSTRPSTHHIHLCVVGSDLERRHLAFRDYLRDHPLVASEYTALKRELAAIHDGGSLESRERYSLSKTEFVSSVLQRAFADGYHDADTRMP